MELLSEVTELCTKNVSTGKLKVRFCVVQGVPETDGRSSNMDSACAEMMKKGDKQMM